MLIDQLKEKLIYITETNKHWIFRCPFCGDSKDQKKGHLSVSKASPVFRCVRCGDGGHISKLIEISQLELSSFYQNLDKYVSTKTKISITLTNFDYEEFILEYLGDRLSVDVIPNSLNILTYKDYKSIIRKHKLGRSFDKVVPFLTHNGNKLVCRVIGESEVRYYNYELNPDPDYYTIFNEYNFSDFRKHKTIVIAEGIFDIVNTFLNKPIEFPKGTVFIAALSKSFNSAFKFIRNLTLCSYPNIIMLADNDTENEHYIRDPQITYRTLKIYRNESGKDFGEKIVNPKLSLSKDGVCV